MTADLVVRGGALDGSACDIVVEAGTIAAVTSAGAGGRGARTIEADGLTVLPGAIDAHVHFDAPGRDEWEGWASGSLAAAAGGVTTVVDMPIDSHPPTIDAAAVRAKQAAAAAASIVDFAFWGGLVPYNATSLDALLGSGVVGLKAFLCESGWPEFPPCGPDELALGMRAAAAAGLPVAVHCEDPAHFSPDQRDRPVASEVAAVALAGSLASTEGAALHVVHCSSADAVTEARRWPATTVETCPHYLALNDADAARIGPDAMCCPPLRDEENRRRLHALAASGAIHSVASDHSPCPPEEKEGSTPFAGVSGVETSLSILLSLGTLSVADIVRLRTAAAALCQLRGKGAVAPGYDADLALVDLDARWVVGPDTLHSRHRRSPFVGSTLPGVVATTIVRGTVVYEAGAAAADPQGRFLVPGRRAENPRAMEANR
ncbi:MAG TPA: allantoinase AllB [Acidimicrobiales bacterium]|nr:allantoinase AllB [Acidimicrobiales bacterium]